MAQTAILPSPGGARQIKVFGDFKLNIGILLLDEHKFVAKTVPPRFVADELLLFEIIHPFEVGRNEDIRRTTLRDLFGENGRGCISDLDRLACISLPGVGDGIERSLHAGGGEDDRRGFRTRCNGGGSFFPGKKTLESEERKHPSEE